MKRTELYDLVWLKPMTHLAKEYGLSDVGLRKICVRHGIPTPPLGYWAKLAHGKPGRQIPLPDPEGGAGEDVHLVVRPRKITPPEVLAARQTAFGLESRPENMIEVPSRRPEDLHPVAEKIEKALWKARPDEEGFVHCDRKGLPRVEIGPGSIDRAVILIDTFIKTAVLRGHTISAKDGIFHMAVEKEVFALRFYETKDKNHHEPTEKELKKQAEEDKWRSRMPEIYSSDRKVYRTWDYFPSGRLSLEIRDPTSPDWNGENLVGRWHDSKNKKLEDCLPQIMAALASAPVSVRHRRAERAEQARILAEEDERWCQEVARKERARMRRAFIEEKATEYRS
jgi:hypothetical protein